MSPHGARDLAGLVLSCPASRCGAQSVTAERPLGKRLVGFSCHSREVCLLPLRLGRELSLRHHLGLPDPALPLPGLPAADSRAGPLTLSSAPVTRNPEHHTCVSELCVPSPSSCRWLSVSTPLGGGSSDLNCVCPVGGTLGRGPRGSGGPRRLGGNWVQPAECGSILAPEPCAVDPASAGRSESASWSRRPARTCWV